MPAVEFVVVPLCNFGVSKKRVVAAKEAGLDTAGDVVRRRIVFSRRVARVLPIAILRLINSEPLK